MSLINVDELGWGGSSPPTVLCQAEEWVAGAGLPPTFRGPDLPIAEFLAYVEMMAGSFEIPSSYVPGAQLFLYFKFDVADNNPANGFAADVSSGYLADGQAVPAVATHVPGLVPLSPTLVVAEVQTAPLMELTDSSGEIGGIPVAAGDEISILFAARLPVPPPPAGPFRVHLNTMQVHQVP